MRTGLTLALLLAGPFAAVAADVGPTRDAFVATVDPLGEPVQNVVYLNQGWAPSRSLEFYFTPQGSQIIPYQWFLALEQPDSTTPFRDNQNILRFRYLPQLPDSKNPDGLPVGFVGDSATNPNWMGLTCAACHTNEIRYKTTGYRVDGAPTQGDVRALLSSMIDALQKTLDDPAKFARFAAQVLKNHNDPTSQALLKKQIAAEIEVRVGYNMRNFPGYNPHVSPAPPPADYGRLDAFGAIINEVFYHAEKSPAPPTGTSKPADAPVSYPFLWDTPAQNLVQWVGLPNGGLNSLARNVGEVLGVFANYKIPDEHLVFGYPSSVKVVALLQLEDWVKELDSPQWPTDFPPIDQAAAAKGKALYQTNCIRCHVLIDPNSSDPTNTAFMSASGTDPKTYTNIFTRISASGKLEGAFDNVVNITSFAKIPPTADALTMVTNEVIGTILGDWMGAPTDEVSRIDMRKKPASMFLSETATGPKYKARALNGIWATAPYLHNNSVP
ncbi:MAG TPA: cytochrome c, partial [Isosphaeraceae bacterium]|nr:cytochrome c [Isosphaeraceae bacterium]